MRVCPRGEAAYPRSSSLRDSNSSTRAELWVSSAGITGYVTGDSNRGSGENSLNSRAGYLDSSGGKTNGEERSALSFVLTANVATVILNHAVDRAEAQPGAFTNW